MIDEFITFCNQVKYQVFTLILGYLLLVRMTNEVNCISSIEIISSTDNRHLLGQFFPVSFLCLFAYLSFVNIFHFFVFVLKELSLKHLVQEKLENVDTSSYFLYRLDNLYSHSKRFKQKLLVVATVLLVCVGGLLWCVVTHEPIIESLWVSWTFISDPGTHSSTKGIIPRVIGFVISICGMVVFAVAVGVVNDDLYEVIENLKRGKSRVVESNHTLILGQVWYSIWIFEKL